jgi:hypothetical protein
VVLPREAAFASSSRGEAARLFLADDSETAEGQPQPQPGG